MSLLNNHTHYSLLRGVPKVNELVSAAKERGYKSVAITDNTNMYGAIQFYKECKKQEIKPIIGVSFFVKQGNDAFNRIIILAKNFEGYKNLMLLTTLAQSERESAQRHITLESISRHKEGLVIIFPSINSPIHASLDKEAVATEKIQEFKKIMKNNFYLSITTEKQQDIEISKKVLELGKKTKTKVLPVPLTYYIEFKDDEARNVLFNIRKTNRPELEEEDLKIDLSLPTKKELKDFCKKIDETVYTNLEELEKEINLEIDLGNWVFPKPPVEVANKEEYLREKVEEGLGRRNLKETKEIRERIEFELGIIFKRGYADYFISLIDIIDYMHKQKILTTTRGSAAGSLVAYLTHITSIDPIEYKLPFERFLNPFRPSPPDIDVDIADDKRGEVFEYISKSFGKENVAQIGTFGTMMARAAVRDTARALGYSYTSGDRIAKLIPLGKQGMPMYIDKALEEVKELRDLYKDDETVKHIINTAKRLEGNVRHISVHAAGFVISPTTITNYTPLELDPKVGDKFITQYNMHAIEDAGLLKFDFLGLTNLSILSEAIDKIEKKTGNRIDIENIPLDDKKVFKLLGDGFTTGVFQVGGQGMTHALTKMQPESIHDISAIIALYRPGPMKNIDEYIYRKHKKKPTTYLHEKMKGYLKDSFGVLVYQDDLLYTALELANYDWKEVDVFRKAVGKKIPELMAEQEIEFKKRVQEHSKVSRSVANELWDLFDPFKGYGFNKAHAMSYAKLSYQTAYVKAYYPAEYLTACLSAAIGDVDTVADLTYEAKDLGIKILPPDVNKSGPLFTTEYSDKEANIRVGLINIKKVGESVASSIQEERKNGEFVNLADFLQRMAKHKTLNKGAVESLIRVGALDAFGKRGNLVEPKNLEKILSFVKDASQENKGQASLFGEALPQSEIHLEDAIPITKSQRLLWEKELLGIYATGHPLEDYKPEKYRIDEIKMKKLEGKNVSLLGVISSIKTTRTKKGERMFFLTLEDEKNKRIDAVCFNDVIESYEELIAASRPVSVIGETKERNGDISLRIEKVREPILKTQNDLA